MAKKPRSTLFLKDGTVSVRLRIDRKLYDLARAMAATHPPEYGYTAEGELERLLEEGVTAAVEEEKRELAELVEEAERAGLVDGRPRPVGDDLDDDIPF